MAGADSPDTVACTRVPCDRVPRERCHRDRVPRDRNYRDRVPCERVPCDRVPRDRDPCDRDPRDRDPRDRAPMLFLIPNLIQSSARTYGQLKPGKVGKNLVAESLSLTRMVWAGNGGEVEAGLSLAKVQSPNGNPCV